MKNLYKGFSFKNYQQRKTFRLNDVELVKQDLLNHIFTRPGERVGLSNFGTVIPDLLFEPFDNETISLAVDQVLNVINFDPRVELRDENEDFEVNADFETSRLDIRARLRFIELDLTDIFDVNLEFEA